MFRKDFIPELDGLRGIAVLMVLWVHLPPDALGETVRGLQQVIVPGGVGVDLFFVLSGFLITRILLVDREQGKSLRHFLMRRFLRIFPIYYLLLAILAAWMHWKEVVACATYTSNYLFLFKSRTSLLEHTWSLAVEEHFYLLWPPVVVFLRPVMSRRVLLLGILPLSALTCLLALHFGNWVEDGSVLREFLGRGSTSRFGSLGIGALLAYHEGFARNGGWKPLGLALACLTIAVLISKSGAQWIGLDDALLELSLFQGERTSVRAALMQFQLPAFSLGLVLLAVVHTGRNLPWSWLFRSTTLRSIGRVSYGLYLYHYPIFRTVFVPDGVHVPTTTGLVLQALGLSFLAATASYWLLERPLMKVSARFREKTPAIAA